MSTTILAIGGYTDTVTPTIESYDVAADRWTPAGWLHCRRDSASATVLDGYAYVCGGRDSDFADVGAIECHDPATCVENAWMELPWMKQYRNRAAVVGHDGRLFVIGGLNGGRLTSVERYDVASRTWSRGTDLPTGLGPATAAFFDGRVWVLGQTSLTDWEVWSGNLAGEAWERRGRFRCDRKWVTVAAHDNAFYLFGGVTVDADLEHGLTPIVERYDLDGGQLVRIPDLPTARHSAAAVSAGGRVFVIGGDGPIYQRNAATEAFDVATSSWHRLAPMLEGRLLPCAVAI